MSEARKNIAENIVKLRKEKKWTQAELAEHLNYSDKAISKWERGESTPDADSLLELANLFNVTVDYFFHNEEEQKQYVLPSKDLKIRNLLILILSCTSAITIAVAIFIFGCYRGGSVAENAKMYWISFIYPLPICSLFCTIYLSRKYTNNPVGFLVSLSITIWTALTVVFLQMLILHMNFWMVYLIGIPIQAAIILAHFVRK